MTLQATDSISVVRAPHETSGSHRATGFGYIPGLNGIRAVAVMAVLFFHADATWMNGGFLGVDVFFVLSGFLITTLILEELDRNDRIDFRRFYARRARRLLPALFGVLFFSGILALTIARDAAAQFREDALASLVYASNWWFIAQDSSYFEAIGRPPLLQHLWSLAVEEQFYLIWPVVALLIWRWRGRLGVGQVALYASLGSSLLMMLLAVLRNLPGSGDASRLYFGSDTHCMGLLLGAALAANFRPWRLPRDLQRGSQAALAGLGVLGILGLWASFTWFTETSDFLYRGGFLLVSAFSAALIVATCHPAIPFGRAMAIQPLNYLGTRSYGIYLWHWPIFMVTRPGIDLPLEGTAALVLRIGLTLGVAELSYRYLEMPVRNGAIGRSLSTWRQHGIAAKRMLAITGGSIATLLIMGFALAAVPTTNASDYLGGVSAVGDEDLSQQGLHQRIDGQEAPPPSTPLADLTAQPITAVGDSVLLGDRVLLKRFLPGITVDAAVARQSETVFDRIRARKAAGALANVVVVHTGTNGTVLPESLDEILTELRDRSRVVIVNTRVPRKWMNSNNDAIAKVASRHPNVVVMDWATVSQGNRDYFVEDGVHLSESGGMAYAKALRVALGGSETPPKRSDVPPNQVDTGIDSAVTPAGDTPSAQ